MTSGSGAGSETSAVCSEPSAASRTICAFRAVAGINPAGIVTAADGSLQTTEVALPAPEPLSVQLPENGGFIAVLE